MDTDSAEAAAPPIGYVVLPLAILSRPGLTDSDIRILLILDHFAFRTGKQDGIVRETNVKIGAMAGKSRSSVCAALRRLEAIEPRILTRERPTPTNREFIRLCYDRYGQARTNQGNRRTTAYVNPRQDSGLLGDAYREYLLSPEWKARRDKAISWAGGRCQLCNATGPFEVHHRTYERAGREAPGDLVALCVPCHTWFHEHRTLA